MNRNVRLNKEKIQKTALLIGATVILVLIGFFAGRVSTNSDERYKDDHNTLSEESALPIVQGEHPRETSTPTVPENELETPNILADASLSEPIETQQDKHYTLKLVLGELVVFHQNEVMLKFVLPESMPEEVLAQLNNGIEFESLSDIESYLDAFYS